MSLTPNLPKQFILARESDLQTVLPERPSGTYLGARVYAALRTKGPDPKKDYFVGFSGGPVLAPQGFYPLEAPMGASTKKEGSRFWSEDKDGSIFSSAEERLVFKPGQVELGIKLGGLGTAKLKEGLGKLKSSGSGAYVPGEVYARIESFIEAAQQHISKLSSMLPSEKSEQIGPAAKREFELAARNRAQAAEWLEFAKLRSSELSYRDLKCGEGSKIDFMSGECMAAPAAPAAPVKGSAASPRQPRIPGSSKPTSGASAPTRGASRRRAAPWSGGAIAGVVVGTIALLGVAGTVALRRAKAL